MIWVTFSFLTVDSVLSFSLTLSSSQCFYFFNGSNKDLIIISSISHISDDNKDVWKWVGTGLALGANNNRYKYWSPNKSQVSLTKNKLDIAYFKTSKSTNCIFMILVLDCSKRFTIFTVLNE